MFTGNFPKGQIKVKTKVRTLRERYNSRALEFAYVPFLELPIDRSMPNMITHHVINQ